MKDRILEFLNLENKTSSQFAEEIGVQPSSISHILSGRNKPSLDFVIKMLEAYSDLSTDWLIFGRGDMYSESGSVNSVHIQPEDAIVGSLFDEEKAYNGESGKEPGGESRQMTDSNAAETSPASDITLSKVILLYSDGTFSEFSK